MKPNITLAGFMGTGKSTVGELLSKALGYTFIDMDRLIEERAGQPISAIFAEQGEQAFRAMEAALAEDLGRREGLVVAAGGGMVLRPENVAALGRKGLVVCLQASADTVLERVAAAGHRPLLEEGDKAERIRSLLAQRQKIYDALPLQVRTDGLAPDEVAERVLTLVRAAEAGENGHPSP